MSASGETILAGPLGASTALAAGRYVGSLRSGTNGETDRGGSLEASTAPVAAGVVKNSASDRSTAISGRSPFRTALLSTLNDDFADAVSTAFCCIFRRHSNNPASAKAARPAIPPSAAPMTVFLLTGRSASPEEALSISLVALVDVELTRSDVTMDP